MQGFGVYAPLSNACCDSVIASKVAYANAQYVPYARAEQAAAYAQYVADLQDHANWFFQVDPITDAPSRCRWIAPRSYYDDQGHAVTLPETTDDLSSCSGGQQSASMSGGTWLLVGVVALGVYFFATSKG